MRRPGDRPGWDDYFMELARVASTRSNCLRRDVGAVVVRDRRVVSTGYNGTARGTANCFDGGCPRCKGAGASGADLDRCLCSHAEENAIVQAAFHGTSVAGGAMYTTLSPCTGCSRMIINAGILEVVYGREYPLAESSLSLLREAGVKARRHA